MEFKIGFVSLLKTRLVGKKATDIKRDSLNHLMRISQRVNLKTKTFQKMLILQVSPLKSVAEKNSKKPPETVNENEVQFKDYNAVNDPQQTKPIKKYPILFFIFTFSRHWGTLSKQDKTMGFSGY